MAIGTFDFIQIAAKSDGKDYPQYSSAPLAELQIHGTGDALHLFGEDHGRQHGGSDRQVAGRVNNKGTRRISADGKTMTLNVAGCPARWSGNSNCSSYSRNADGEASMAPKEDKWQEERVGTPIDTRRTSGRLRWVSMPTRIPSDSSIRTNGADFWPKIWAHTFGPITEQLKLGFALTLSIRLSLSSRRSCSRLPRAVG